MSYKKRGGDYPPPFFIRPSSSLLGDLFPDGDYISGRPRHIILGQFGLGGIVWGKFQILLPALYGLLLVTTVQINPTQREMHVDMARIQLENPLILHHSLFPPHFGVIG